MNKASCSGTTSGERVVYVRVTTCDDLVTTFLGGRHRWSPRHCWARAYLVTT